MTRAQSVRVSLSVFMAVLATAGLVYWGAGMPDGGIRINADIFAILQYGEAMMIISLVILLALLVIAFRILPKVSTRSKLALLERWVIAGVFGIGLTLISLLIPFPQDYPACCMQGPTRERGLPLAYTRSIASFGEKPTFPAPTVNWPSLVLNLGFWAFIYFYVERLAKVRYLTTVDEVEHKKGKK